MDRNLTWLQRIFLSTLLIVGGRALYKRDPDGPGFWLGVSLSACGTNLLSRGIEPLIKGYARKRGWVPG